MAYVCTTIVLYSAYYFKYVLYLYVLVFLWQTLGVRRMWGWFWLEQVVLIHTDLLAEVCKVQGRSF